MTSRAFLVALCTALAAQAGDVNETDGLGLKGYDPVAYFREGVPAKGAAAFTLVGGKLYLNYNAQVKADWQKDTMGHIRRADDRWPQVRPQTKVVK